MLVTGYACSRDDTVNRAERRKVLMTQAGSCDWGAVGS